MMPLRDRYHSDPAFKMLVDMMVHHIFQCQYTPSEMREAAMLASIIYEELNYRQMVFINDDIELHLRAIHEKLTAPILRKDNDGKNE